VAPNSVDIWKGRTQDFAVIVEGTNNPDPRVIWAVSDNTSQDTQFKDNILYVAVDETAEHFTVTATSVFDPSKSSSSNVNLVRPKVTGVTIFETDASIYQGGSMDFHATVEGPKGPDQDVVWSVTGNSSSATKFTDNTLTIAGNETSKSWTIKATSYFDGENSGTATVKLAYEITVQHSTYGRIDPKYQDRLNEYAPEGRTVTIEVNPEKYYKLKNLQYTVGSRIVPIDKTSRTFTMPASDITISAAFEELAVGDPGPGGGWIFYKNPNRSSPWQYLECAPTDISAKTWSTSTTPLLTLNELGRGKENMSKFNDAAGTFPAAAEAAAYKSNGVGGWYLPSKRELEEIRSKLQANTKFKASVQNKPYWSSTEESIFGSQRGKRAMTLNLGASSGGAVVVSKTVAHLVRAVRQF
jgi:hypothetical protein